MAMYPQFTKPRRRRPALLFSLLLAFWATVAIVRGVVPDHDFSMLTEIEFNQSMVPASQEFDALPDFEENPVIYQDI